MKCHVRREFGIAGIKILTRKDSEKGCMVCPKQFTDWLQVFSESLPSVIAANSRELTVIIEWIKNKHTPPLYYTEHVVNETILSRLFGYSKKPKKFIWTEGRKARVLKWSNNPNFSKEFITQYVPTVLHCAGSG
jgi:hypothetical protein